MAFLPYKVNFYYDTPLSFTERYWGCNINKLKHTVFVEKAKGSRNLTPLYNKDGKSGSFTLFNIKLNVATEKVV